MIPIEVLCGVALAKTIQLRVVKLVQTSTLLTTFTTVGYIEKRHK